MAESLRERWFEAFIKGTLARPWRVLGVFILLALGGGLLSSRLEFRGSFVELLPRETREVQHLERVSAKAGGDGYLVVRARGATPEVLRSFSDALAGRLEELEEVRYVEHRFDVGFFQERGLLLMPAERLKELRQDVEARLRYEKRKANPFYVELRKTEEPPDFEALLRKYAPETPMREYLSSEDGSEVYLMVKPAGTAGDLMFAQRLVDAVRRVAEEVVRDWEGVELDYAGAFQNRLEEDEVMRRDLSRAALLSAAMAVAIILLATRRVWALAVVGLPVLIGVALTFAFAEVAIGHLNIVTGFLVAILIGLGLEYGIHLAMRYWEERRELPAERALRAAVRGTFAGALTSATTNAAAFFVLVLARFQAFNQFGLLAGVGVVLAVAVAYGLGPALLTLAERLHLGRPPAPPEPEAVRVKELPRRRWPTTLVLGL
ncbi:MAG TPA: MMPL family transporter, partial [Myxococcaceae bacterium]|nr:MMPL family transporter [Myxococcaceae bacterium]